VPKPDFPLTRISFYAIKMKAARGLLRSLSARQSTGTLNSALLGRCAVMAGLGIVWANSESWKTRANAQAREFVACKLHELEEGILREFVLDEGCNTKLAVVKIGGKAYALSGICPSKGGSVADGFVHEQTIYCRDALSNFDITTGELLGGAACNSLRSYPTRIVDNQVIVSVSEEDFETPCVGRLPAMTIPDGSDSRIFVIIGTGPGGMACAEQLRRSGF
jgi:nitrite reductase/ring-hydroxylating ferredoxin subunit